MNTAQLLSKLKVQIANLEQEVLTHDAMLPPGHEKLLQNIERFNDDLFVQTGAKLMPCIQQLQRDTLQLEKLIRLKATSLSVIHSCERLQQRFLAVKRAMATTSLNVKSVKQQQVSRRARSARYQQQAHQKTGFSWIASNVMRSSHQLYQELNKHLNWAKRLEFKIQQLQLQLENCHSADKIALQNDILQTHRRLGKCQQAVSYIEERIQFFERPHKSNNR